jgi:hypothetical protein
MEDPTKLIERDDAKRMVQILLENRKENLVKRKQDQVLEGKATTDGADEKKTTVKELIKQSYYKPIA